MLELHNLTIKNNNKHLLNDVSLRFSDKGCVSLTVDNDACANHISRILSGIELPQEGYLLYHKHRLDNQKQEEDLARYRQLYVKSIAGTFLILNDKTIEENITMGLNVSQDILEIVLQKWRLTNFRNRKAESLDFARQARLILARISLQVPSLLIVTPNTMPYSTHELDKFYQLLQAIGKDMLVIVINAPVFERYANRVIAIKHGYVLSDNLNMEEEDVELGHEPEIFHIPEDNIQSIRKEVYQKDRFKYRLLSILFIVSLLCVSLFLFTNKMDIVDMNLQILKQENAHMFAIQKKAVGDDDTIYDSQYTVLSQNDEDELKIKLKDTILSSYYPIDTKFANSYLEGNYTKDMYTQASYAAVIELPETKEIKQLSIVGVLPENTNEVMLSLADARKFIGVKQEDREESYLGEEFYWYGLPLKITAIMSEEGFYSLETYDVWGDISNSRIFVTKDFVKQHPLNELKSYPVSNKRMLTDNKFYSFSLLYPLSSKRPYNYTDGVSIQKSDIPESDEALLDYDMAISLGFHPDMNAEYEQQLVDYQQFCAKWVGKKVQLQTYTIATSATNSMLLNTVVSIEGFLFPQDQDFTNHVYEEHSRSIYISSNYLNDAMQANIGISNIYYMNFDEEQMRNALTKIQDDKLYEAILPGDMPLQYLVRDLKSLNQFLLFSSIFLVGISMILYVDLTQQLIKHAKKRMSIFYTFGEDRKHIIRIYMRYSARILLKNFCVSLAFSLLVILLLTLSIVSQLYETSHIIWYMMMPFVFAVVIFVVMQVIAYLLLRFHNLFYEPYNS